MTRVWLVGDGVVLGRAPILAGRERGVGVRYDQASAERGRCREILRRFYLTEERPMVVWFEGTTEVECGLPAVMHSLEDLGEHSVGVVGLMPGLSDVELLEQGSDFVTIRTNEGRMERTNITTSLEGDRTAVEFDEQYQAGSRVTTTAHFAEDFTTNGTGVTYRVVVNDLAAPGFLGFLYRRFGSAKMGRAFLEAQKRHLEALSA